LAAAALCVAACGAPNQTNTGAPTESPSPKTSAPTSAPVPLPPPTPPSAGKDHVEGMVRSVSGGVIQLRTRTGSATVDFAPTTMVTEAAPAKLADVKPGSCASVLAGKQGPAVQSIKISPAVNGRCLPPPEATSGGAAPEPNAEPSGVFGQVASVSGNTIAVNTLAPDGKVTPVNVTVADSTTYSNDAVTNDQAITDGKCMAAQGTEGGGALQATAVSLQPCPPMGGGHHHHLPHLPIHLPFHL
jgi:hypothetical protein